MVLFRALGWLLLAASVAMAVRDGLYWWSERTFHALSLGELWLLLDFGSLQSLEASVVRHLSTMAWARLATPVLAIPATPVFVILGLFLLWLGQPRGRRAEGSFVGSRPPRRRRGRRGSLS